MFFNVKNSFGVENTKYVIQRFKESQADNKDLPNLQREKSLNL